MASILETSGNEVVTIGGLHIRIEDLAAACGRIHTQAICEGDHWEGFNEAVHTLARLLNTGCATRTHKP